MNDLAADYLERHAKLNKRASSAASDQAALKRHILPKLGGKKVINVSRRDVQDFHAGLKGTPHAANRALALLSKMFSLAVQWGVRPDNPVKGVQRYAEERREIWMSDAELKKLLTALEGHRNERAANVVRLLLLTRARRNEVLRATWDQFDLQAGTWTKPAHCTKQNKLHHARLSAPAKALLAAMKREGDPRCPFLFPGDAEGKPMDNIKRFWAKLQEQADIWEELPGHAPEKPKRRFVPKFRLHDLRHTVASHLVNDGAPLAVVKDQLGHTQMATTMRYAHLAPSATLAAAERFGAKLEALAAAQPTAEVVELRPAQAA